MLLQVLPKSAPKSAPEDKESPKQPEASGSGAPTVRAPKRSKTFAELVAKPKEGGDASKGRNARKQRIGIVTSTAMDKSIIVAVRRRIKHPIYKKFIRRTTRLMSHDAQNECKVGDVVQIMETRPLSRHKNWRLVKVLEKTK